MLLLGGAAVLGIPTVQRALAFADSSGAAVSEAAEAVGAVADSFDGVQSSLADAERAASSAATASRRSAETARRLAGAMSVSILGARPLEPMARDFLAQAGQLDDLAHDLDSLARSLGRNRHDAGLIGANLERLHDRLDRGAPPDTAGAALGYGDATRLLIGALVLWLLLPSLAAITFGVMLRRAGDPRSAL